MKKVYFAAAAAAIMTASCNNLSNINTETPVSERAKITVNIYGATSTKASAGVSAENESAVSDLQLFVFDSSGKIESYQKSQSRTFSLNVSTGNKDFIALANCPDLGSVATKDELLQTVSRLENNGLAHFEMAGQKSGSISGKTTVNIEVKRLVAKVSIDRITASFTSPYLASLEFKVLGIYLTNVVSTNNYAMTAGTFNWLNKLSRDDSSPAAALTQDSINQVITSASPYTASHTFYCYPNPTSSDSESASWSDRHTRLVVEASLGGNTVYYPVQLPIIERNKSYSITNLVISKKGSSHPWEDIKTADIEYSITVADWETGQNMGTVEI